MWIVYDTALYTCSTQPKRRLAFRNRLVQVLLLLYPNRTYPLHVIITVNIIIVIFYYYYYYIIIAVRSSGWVVLDMRAARRHHNTNVILQFSVCPCETCATRSRDVYLDKKKKFIILFKLFVSRVYRTCINA